MLTRTEGIVLKSREYGEADLIVTYLTPGSGIITAFAKSPRKVKSRFGSSLEPFTHARITLWGREGLMPRLTGSDILNPFQNLREDLELYIKVSRFVEIMLSLVPERTADSRLFSLLLNTMDLLGASTSTKRDALYLISMIHLLGILGYAPWLKGCGGCGDMSLQFYPDSGTVLCDRCAFRQGFLESRPIGLSRGSLNFYCRIIECPPDISDRFIPHPKIISELSSLLDEHLSHILKRRLHSSKFLEGGIAGLTS